MSGSAPNSMRTQRMMRELQLLQSPPQGIQAYPKTSSSTNNNNNNNNSSNNMFELEGLIRGATDTPYENGIFKMDISIPDRYPIEPPNIRFITPIYHPNIDDRGRICLDILNMPPKGAWKPSLNISTVLTSLLSLMSEPNPDDGLMSNITEQYRNSRSQFERVAREYTKKYAMSDVIKSSEQEQKSQVDSEDEESSSDDDDESDGETGSNKKGTHGGVKEQEPVEGNAAESTGTITAEKADHRSAASPSDQNYGETSDWSQSSTAKTSKRTLSLKRTSTAKDRDDAKRIKL